MTTRERILQHGLALLSQAGLAGVTLGVLADRVGMSKSGLFAHFRSIEEVQISLLRHTAEIAERHVVAPAMRAPQGLRRLEALVRNWLGWSGKAGLGGGCPMGSSPWHGCSTRDGTCCTTSMAADRALRRVRPSAARSATR